MISHLCQHDEHAPHCAGRITRDGARVFCECPCHTPESQQNPSPYWVPRPNTIHVEKRPRKKAKAPTRTKRKTVPAPFQHFSSARVALPTPDPAPPESAEYCFARALIGASEPPAGFWTFLYRHYFTTWNVLTRTAPKILAVAWHAPAPEDQLEYLRQLYSDRWQSAEVLYERQASEVSRQHSGEFYELRHYQGKVDRLIRELREVEKGDGREHLKARLREAQLRLAAYTDSE